MKITAVEPILVSVPFEFDGPSKMEILLLKVSTDSGITGWGEGFSSRGGSVVWEAASTIVAPNAVGGNPADIASIIGPIERLFHNVGRNGPLSYALSALDIALWDINAQAAGQPLHRYLGGRASQGIDAYASLFRIHDPERVRRETEKAVEQGYRHVKIHEIHVAEVAAARQSIGPGTPLMVDTNAPWNSDEAPSHARELAEFDLKWLEEPIWPPEDYDGYLKLRKAVDVPLAAGENAGILGLKQMIRHNIVDYVQPSVTKAGGVTAFVEIVGLARKSNIHLGPHSPYLGPGLVATMHLMSALIPEGAVEHRFCTMEASPFVEPLQLVDGKLVMPQGAGLGIAVSDRFIAKYRIK